MLKLQVGMTKKLGLSDYGSVGAHCQLEIEVDRSAASGELPALQDHIEQAYAVCTRAVHRQLAKQIAYSGRDRRSEITNAFGTTSTSTIRARELNEPAASTRQLIYIQQLADESGPHAPNPAQWAQQLFDKPLSQLSRRQASGLIDLLRYIKHGKLDGVALTPNDASEDIPRPG